MRRIPRWLLIPLRIAILVYVGVCALMFFTQRSLIYYPQPRANRDGVPPVDLIDGDRLCELLKEYELGVRTIEVAAVAAAFFSDI